MRRRCSDTSVGGGASGRAVALQSRSLPIPRIGLSTQPTCCRKAHTRRACARHGDTRLEAPVAVAPSDHAPSSVHACAAEPCRRWGDVHCSDQTRPEAPLRAGARPLRVLAITYVLFLRLYPATVHTPS